MMFSSDTWKLYKKRVEMTEVSSFQLTELCLHVLQSMQSMTSLLNNNVRTMWGKKQLPPYQQFVSVYFVRNLTYLRPAYFLACASLCGPSRNLQRTIYETILRGYLFIVNHNEANLMHSYIEQTLTKKQLGLLRRRKFWPFSFMINCLYTKKLMKQHKTMFNAISRFSHPSIRGVYKDLEYSEDEVKDCLNIILGLGYSNIQMMSEGFYQFLNPTLKGVIKETLFEIADFQGTISLFEPNKREWSSKIKLKNGNFLTVLK